MGTVTAPSRELSAEATRLISEIWDYLELLKGHHIGEKQVFTLKEVIYRDGEVANEVILRSIRLKLKDKWEKTPVKSPTKNQNDGGEGSYES